MPPFDLVVATDTGIKRVQVKYREQTNGCLSANLFNAWGNVGKGCVVGKRYDPTDVDVIALTDGNVVAYINYTNLNVNTITIRIDPVIKQDTRIRMIKDYQTI